MLLFASDDFKSLSIWKYFLLKTWFVLYVMFDLPLPKCVISKKFAELDGRSIIVIWLALKYSTNAFALSGVISPNLLLIKLSISLSGSLATDRLSLSFVSWIVSAAILVDLPWCRSTLIPAGGAGGSSSVFQYVWTSLTSETRILFILLWSSSLNSFKGAAPLLILLTWNQLSNTGSKQISHPQNLSISLNFGFQNGMSNSGSLTSRFFLKMEMPSFRWTHLFLLSSWSPATLLPPPLAMNSFGRSE